mmetsp:Transcript_33109/g.72121  ORF Transcript_33109/g.72121 Transcript_33109/m.72121 type:complete len:362 (+) Transcript_33109:76-1161(+)
MADKLEEIDRLVFMRITLLGASNSGKSSLVGAFVNGNCPIRYVRTDSSAVYYKMVEMIDEGEFEDVKRPVLIEIEDTPGSELGHPDEEEGGGAPTDGAPQIRRGSRITVIGREHKTKFLAMFEDPKYKDTLHYRQEMDGMLGREYPVRSIGKDGSIGLPSPDGSEGGVWNFPPKACKLKVSMDLPIDQFLNLGEKEQRKLELLKDRKKHTEQLQFPLSAYTRPIGGSEFDKTLTKNRMGYFICFDLSDDQGESLKEAMNVHALMQKTLASKKSSRLNPLVWLIGCKADRTAVNQKAARESAKLWSDQEEIPFFVTSSRNYHNVTSVFLDMVQAISAHENLWSLEGVDEPEAEEDNKGCVFS